MIIISAVWKRERMCVRVHMHVYGVLVESATENEQLFANVAAHACKCAWVHVCEYVWCKLHLQWCPHEIDTLPCFESAAENEQLYANVAAHACKCAWVQVCASACACDRGKLHLQWRPHEIDALPCFESAAENVALRVQLEPIRVTVGVYIWVMRVYSVRVRYVCACGGCLYESVWFCLRAVWRAVRVCAVCACVVCAYGACSVWVCACVNLCLLIDVYNCLYGFELWIAFFAVIHRRINKHLLHCAAKNKKTNKIRLVDGKKI